MALAALCGVALSRPTPARADTAADRAALAQWWAPVNFQDVDSTGETALGGKSDHLTSYDYDGDLDGRNNWEDTSQFLLLPAADDGSAHGQLKAAVTVAHSNFYSWVPSGSDFTSGQESVDGTLKLQGDPHDDGHGRPFTTQQPNTHAAWAEGPMSSPPAACGTSAR